MFTSQKNAFFREGLKHSLIGYFNRSLETKFRADFCYSKFVNYFNILVRKLFLFCRNKTHSLHSIKFSWETGTWSLTHFFALILVKTFFTQFSVSNENSVVLYFSFVMFLLLVFYTHDVLTEKSKIFSWHSLLSIVSLQLVLCKFRKNKSVHISEIITWLS